METEAKPIVDEQITQKVAKATKINRLILDGFKSFGKYTELQFGEDFNVILGPNGSGKSNVLDALCFVLGKSSSKQLRAEKSANLIYNGGKTKQPAKTAEVSIVFCNKNKMFPLPDEEIKVSRIVRADGQSKYKINGTTKTRQELIELLNNANINPDGYNIILQGDIIRLVEMSSIERRQLIEEIAGIGIYEEKKQQALNELQKVGERLNEAEIILKERETHLKELKKDRDHALRYKELSDKIKQNKASHLKRKIDKKTEEIQKIEEKSSGHNKKLNICREEINKLRNEIGERKQKIVDINKEIEQKGEIEQLKIQKDLEKLRIELVTNKTRISTITTELSRIEQRKEQLEKNQEDLSLKIKDLTEEKNNLSAQHTSLVKTLEQLEHTIKAFKEKNNLSDQSDIDKKFTELDQKVEEKQKEIQVLHEKQQNFLREKDKAEFQLTTIDQKIARVHELETAHKDELKGLNKKKEEFKKIVLELNDLLNQDSKDANTLARSRIELQQLREEEHKLALKEESVRDSLGQNIAIKKVLENKNKFGEVFGTVAELGSSEGKYAAALEIAAAQKINSIVVGDDKTAANCINYIKNNQFGTATFLPMNKIKPVQIKEDVKALSKKKGVHGLAIDLIDFEPQFKNIFSHVFGNTIIVDDIETARTIGIGEARMVTLDGDLCETSGAMSGGYRHKKAGSFKEKEIGKKLEDTRARLTEIEGDLTSIEGRRKQNEEKIQRLREFKATIEGDIIKQEKSLHLDTGDLDATKTYKEELIKTKDHISKELLTLEDQINTETDTITQIKTQKEQLRAKLTEARNPRILAELHAFEEKRRQLDAEKVRVETEQKNTAAQLNEVISRDQDNIKKILKDMDKEREAFSSEKENITNFIKTQEKELKIKEEEQAKFFTQFKGLLEQTKKLNEDINGRETAILGIEENSRQEELKVNTLSIEEARLKAENAGYTAEFEQYTGVELDMEKPEEQLKKEINEFERMMTNIGNVNMRALEIYETVEKEYQILTEKKGTLLKERDSVLSLMGEIEGKKKELFIASLNTVNEQFKRIFSQITTKGEAYLELENAQDPFAEGLKINVKITGNKFLDIRSLSGGEKTMTALAFLFAIQEHEPANFYVLDEVDAALDKGNSEKLARLIRSYCTKAQYLVISHNDAIIAEGDVLHGVSMNQEAGLSNVVSLKA